MKFIISKNRIEKLINIYFENEFKDSIIEVRNYAGQKWIGVWNPNGEILVGAPEHDKLNDWFFNGQYFNEQWKVFGIELRQFTNYMRNFLNEKYKGIFHIRYIV